MLEISVAEKAIVSCQDRPAILDRLPSFARAFSCRVASDELYLIGAPSDVEALIAYASDAQRKAGGDGIAMDVSDGWAVLTVKGPATDEMIARLSANPVPSERPAVVQGVFAQVPAKLIVLADAVHIMVPSVVCNHVQNRITAACHGLSPSWGRPRRFASVGAAGVVVKAVTR